MSIIGGINFGSLTDYLFYFANGRERADWHDAKHGYLGNVAVDGLKATEQTNGNVPYAGTIYTNDNTLRDWQDIINTNSGQAFESLNQTTKLIGLELSLTNAFQEINALAVTPGFDHRSSGSLNGLNTQNGINEIFVINITSGFDVAEPIHITGDPGDVYILRWDEDNNLANGYQGRVRFRHGGGIVPLGGLTPTNFIHVAGEIDSAGGGSTPPTPYPQGPRYNNGQGTLINGGSDWTAGGFFTGYWLTTGEPTIHDPVTGLYYGVNASLSDAVFVGGWYTITTQFILTAQSGGVYVSPNPATLLIPDISLQKFVSPDNGATWVHADTAPGPNIPSNIEPQFQFVVTNTGNVPLSFVSLSDSVYGPITIGGDLAVGASFDATITLPWSPGEHENEGTVTGNYGREMVTASDFGHYVGVPIEKPAVQIVKLVSPDDGITWVEASTAPGPTILSSVAPQFQFVVANIGTIDLTNVIVTDDKFGVVGGPTTVPVGASAVFSYTAMWEEGLHVNTATVVTDQDVTSESTAYYTGVWANPGITITKYVSGDNGSTWIDANTPPGPSIDSSVSPQFKFVVENTGNVSLFEISVTDDVYGFIGSWPSLAAGATLEQIIIEPWQEGLHENTATVTASFIVDPLTATDSAFYTGVRGPVPSVSIVKYVSVDNGVSWQQSQNPPGPLLPEGVTPQFKYVVTNTGTAPLSNVTVTDNVLGEVVTGASLAVGESGTWFK